MKQLLLIGLWWFCLLTDAQEVEFAPEDSIRIERMLMKAQSEKPENVMLYFGKQFIGIPYVGHTLEEGDKEHLIYPRSILFHCPKPELEQVPITETGGRAVTIYRVAFVFVILLLPLWVGSIKPCHHKIYLMLHFCHF